jgi:hypothetical protein
VLAVAFSKEMLGTGLEQGCQMVCFQTKISNLGQFWAVLQWMKSVNFTAIPSILLPFSIFYGHFAYFVVILHILWSFWYIFPFWYVVPNKIWQPWSRIGSIGFKN